MFIARRARYILQITPNWWKNITLFIKERPHLVSKVFITFRPTGVCALGKIIVLTSRYLDFLFGTLFLSHFSNVSRNLITYLIVVLVEEFFDDEHHTINNPIPEVVLYSQG